MSTAMWVRIDLNSFENQNRGLVERSANGVTLLASSTLFGLTRIEDLAQAEYGIAIEIDSVNRRVRFGRDYLGHFPLLYAISGPYLLISDEISEIRSEIVRTGGRLTVSEESLALYFTMGYVPQGMTLFNQITSCRNASLYEWSAGSVRETRLFRAVEVDLAVTVEDLVDAIDHDVAQLHRQHPSLDVWCSGGLDSSIVAHCAVRQSPTNVNILTMDYDPVIREQFAGGEVPFAQTIADHVGIPLTRVTMSHDRYAKAFQAIAEAHVGPVIDLAVLPKYVLAGASRQCVLTGEGGDPLFAGIKNTPFLFLRQNDPRRSLGYHYAAVHNRFFHQLRDIFVRGAELEEYVVEYFNRLFESYPGDVLRQLFYLNTFEKQGGEIFSESYYAGKRAGVSVRHPLASRRVYDTAFALPDSAKYRYPDGKLALIEAFGSRLPRAIVDRRKSGTIIPLEIYLDGLLLNKEFSLETVREIGGIRKEAIESCVHPARNGRTALEVHAWLMLDRWLTFNNGGANERPANLPSASGNYQ